MYTKPQNGVNAVISIKISRCLKRERDIGRKAVLSDVKTAFTCTLDLTRTDIQARKGQTSMESTKRENTQVKGPRKRGHIVADTNVSPFAHVRDICCGHRFCVRDTKMFLILFRNILCPQQMFPSMRSPSNIMGNNVSATMCPRLPGP